MESELETKKSVSEKAWSKVEIIVLISSLAIGLLMTLSIVTTACKRHSESFSVPTQQENIDMGIELYAMRNTSPEPYVRINEVNEILAFT